MRLTQGHIEGLAWLVGHHRGEEEADIQHVCDASGLGWLQAQLGMHRYVIGPTGSVNAARLPASPTDPSGAVCALQIPHKGDEWEIGRPLREVRR